MILISSLETILELNKKVKDFGKGFLTNFYLDPFRTEIWIKQGLLRHETIGDTEFLCRMNNSFYTLYYITPNVVSLNKDVKKFTSLHRDNLFVTDIIGRQKENLDVIDVFYQNGYFQYTSLSRMSKINNNDFVSDERSKFVEYANPGDAKTIYDLLEQYFDPYAEQLPMLEEIEAFISQNKILIYSEDNQMIQGFLIFELKGLTSYLRYWFVHPNHRDKKVGSSLLRRFFLESREAKRQLFWVIESNENAIKRYAHYGFKKEALFDCVLINKQLCYGR